MWIFFLGLCLVLFFVIFFHFELHSFKLGSVETLRTNQLNEHAKIKFIPM